MAVVITYSSGSNTFVITGGTEGVPATMEDLYTFAYNNLIYVSGLPAVESPVEGNYTIRSNVDFGDDSTATYFTSLNEQVWFDDGFKFLIKDFATLQLGELVGDWSINGSSWSFAPSGNTDIIDNADPDATFSLYGSTLSCRSLVRSVFANGTINLRNSILNGGSSSTSAVRYQFSASSTLNINRVYIAKTAQLFLESGTQSIVKLHLHSTLSGIINGISDIVTVTDVLVTSFSGADFRVQNATNNLIALNPVSGVTAPEILSDETNSIAEQYTFNAHATDKDGADLADVSVDCEYAHLVEGSDSKTYKCSTDFTATDDEFKPIDGSGDWASKWDLYDAAGGSGGDWDNGSFDYKAVAEEFATDTSDANGDFSEQVIQYKKWVGTSELLEARIHKFTFTHADYPDMTVEDVIVSAPIVWRIDMGQSTADIADAVWDAILTGASHNTPTSAGRRLRDLSTSVIITGTSPDTSGTTNTSILIELDNDASAVDGAYDPANIAIVNGTGAGQSRQILEYTGATKLAYVNRDWKVVPDSTSEYVISTSTGDTHVNEGLSGGGTASTIILNSLASTMDDIYNNQTVFIVAGTGADQSRVVADYDGGTITATVDEDWEIAPDTTSIYVMLPIHVHTLEQIQNTNTGSPSLR